MKRLISVITTAALTLSMFCMSFTSHAAVSVTFHSNGESFTKSSDELVNMYYLPPTTDRLIFKGWYYGMSDDAQAVDFEHDSFTENTDVYAHWADIGLVAPDENDSDKGELSSYDGFELLGVQTRSGSLDSKNGGLRFIGTLSNSLLDELDALSDATVSGDYNSRVEYGFVAASEYSINRWKNYAASRSWDISDYQLGYKGTNVNGVSTVEQNADYQIAKNIDCTSSDYSDSTISDYKKFDDYRLYTLAITYENGEDYAASSVAVRAYLRYYDANGLLRTVYNDYGGTNTCGGLSTSYESVSTNTAEPAYYSSFAAMFSDANNMTTDNADSNAADAVCSMYISGGTAYIKLLKDTSLSDKSTFSNNTDLNLNGKTLDANVYRVNSTAEFSMYNGTYSAGSTALAFGQFTGNLTKLTNVSFKASELSISQLFYGVYVPNGGTRSVYLTDCDFDISAQSGSNGCFANIFMSQLAVIRNCTYKVSGGASEYDVVYCHSSILDVEGCTFESEQTAAGSNSTTWAIQSYNSDSTTIKNTTIDFTGNYGVVYGAFVKNTSDTDTSTKYFEAENLTVNMNLGTLTQTSGGSLMVRGVSVGKDVDASIKSLNVDIDTVAPDNTPVCGLLTSNNAVLELEDINIDISATETATFDGNTSARAYAVNGILTGGTSTVTLSSAKIKVPIGYKSNQDNNSGISAINESVVTLSPDSDSDIYIQGGYAALSNSSDAMFYVNGGEYCSQSHGGAYFGGDAVITGGSFFAISEGTYAPQHAGLYVTGDAVVSISGAYMYAYNTGIRVKTQNNRQDNPRVTITNSTISSKNIGVDCDAGTVTLDSTVVNTAPIKTKVSKTGLIIQN